MANGHGGAREGAGRKPRGWYDESENAHAQRFAKARADKEEAMARLRAIEVQSKAADLKERIGDLVRREDVERQFAAYVSTVVQFLDTLPDILERDAGIGGDAVERVQQALDRIRGTLHGELRKQFGA